MTGDEQLRAAYTRAVEARAIPGRSGCVQPEALLALVRREGPEPGRLATLDHAMACPACREEFELLRAIEHAGGEGVRETVERIRWQRYTAIAIAASVVLAVSLGPGHRLWNDPSEAMRGSGDGVVLVGPVPSQAVTPGTPLTFAWRAVSGARRYTVEVLTPDGRVVIERETADTSLTLAAPDALSAGEYRWWVSAQATDGTLSRSEARPLLVRSPRSP